MRRNFKPFSSKTGRSSRPHGKRTKPDFHSGAGIETRSGVGVRSQYEKMCADYLFENGIEFLYEPLMLLGGRQFRPDFFLPEYNLFLEICGYNHMPHYRSRIDKKRETYQKHKLNVVFITCSTKRALIQEIEKAITAGK